MKKRLIVIAVMAIFSLFFSSNSYALVKNKAQKAPVAICHNGRFVAQKDGDILKWLGIPYAKPPVGSLRWKAPILAGNNKTTYSPQGYGKMPLQAWQPKENTSEDCLKLNIYTGSNNEQNKPVIVFLQPSAFAYGASSLPYCDGSKLVSIHPEIIFACIETRLSIVGSMVFDDVPGSDNYSAKETSLLWLLDARCALQWIQKNIKSFGGDPNNVTLFGISAGAVATTLMPLLPNTKGLFQKMIVSSGTPAIIGPSKARANVTKKLMELTGAENMADLMSLSEEQLSEAIPELDKLAQFEILGSEMTIQEIYDAYKAGATRGIPMLIGTTGNECAYFKAINHTNENEALKELKAKYKRTQERLPSSAQKIASKYISSHKRALPSAYEDLFTDTIFTTPALLLADNHSANSPTYMYKFDFSPEGGHTGAPHIAELPFVMNLFKQKKLPERVENLASTIREMWINFAKTGIPSTDTYIWPQYTSSDRNVMIFGQDGAISVEKATSSKETKLLAPLLPYTYIFAEEYFRFPEETYKKIFIKQN